jgi:hypothetical protein
MRIGLVGCVKSKRPVASPAEDLYVSSLFKGRRKAVERSSSHWFILSALHGLVEPKTVLEPYDVSLVTASFPERRRWARGVLEALVRELADFRTITFEIHAGAAYREFGLVDGLLERGAKVEVPMRHLSQGEQLAAYAASAISEPTHQQMRVSDPNGVPDRSPALTGINERRSPGGKYAPLSNLLASLTDSSVRLSFSDIERILGFPLPASARRYPQWWQNDGHGSHSQARSWTGVGWETSGLNLVAARVTFVRVRGQK